MGNGVDPAQINSAFDHNNSSSPLWTKVFFGPKNPGRWPQRGPIKPRSDGGNVTGPDTH